MKGTELFYIAFIFWQVCGTKWGLLMTIIWIACNFSIFSLFILNTPVKRIIWENPINLEPNVGSNNDHIVLFELLQAQRLNKLLWHCEKWRQKGGNIWNDYKLWLILTMRYKHTRLGRQTRERRWIPIQNTDESAYRYDLYSYINTYQRIWAKCSIDRFL